MKAPSPNVSAGALPWRVDSAGEPQVLLVHRRKPGDWAIPKGNLDLGESAPACATRELREETGLGCRLSWTLPTLEYLTRSGEAKTTYYWAVTPTRGKFRANKEIDGVRWFDLPEAAAILTKPRERAIPLALAALLHAELKVTPKRRPRPVLLVRGAAATPEDGGRSTTPRDHSRPTANRSRGRSPAYPPCSRSTAYCPPPRDDVSTPSARWPTGSPWPSRSMTR